jgi:hypothetical protein
MYSKASHSPFGQTGALLQAAAEKGGRVVNGLSRQSRENTRPVIERKTLLQKTCSNVATD